MREGIDHVGIAVRDPDAAVRFDVDVLAMSLLGQETHEEQGERQARPGGDAPLVNFVHPRGVGGVLTELVERPAEDPR